MAEYTIDKINFSGNKYILQDSNALPLTGGSVTGPVNFGDTVSIDEATIGDLVVNGSASFTNNLQANTINGVTVGNSPKFTDTTYSSLAAASGGTAVSLVTTGEKYTWNSKTANVGTITGVTAGTGLSGGGTSSTVTLNHSNSVTAQTTQAVYPIKIDAQGHISAYGNAVTIPTVPSNIVNTITTTAGAHTAISSKTGAVSFNVPTKTSHLTNDSGFLTSHQTLYEANLVWGGKDFSAGYGPIDAAMIDVLGANRFAFLKAAGLTIEYSTDGGSTWTDYGATDTQKVGLFSSGQAFYLGKHTASATSTTNDQLRVTINTGTAGIYTVLNKIAIYMSTQGNTTQVKIERATQGDPTTYTTHKDWTGISGWSGWNILNMSGLTTYGNQNYQYGRVRFTFRQTAVNANNAAACISRIMGFGGVGWAVPSTMAATGHLYSYDANQNATFPAKVTASGGFSGNLTGNVTGNVSGTAANVTGTVAIANGGTGQTTASAAANTLITSLPTWTAIPTDDTYLIRRDTGGSAQYGQVKFSTIWSYIDSKANTAGYSKTSVTSVTLPAAAWSNLTCTVTVSGVTTSNTIIVSPDPSSYAEYGKAGVYCSAQATNSLTFTCSTVPTNDITVNILIITQVN